jgi:hypothetical protein
MAVEGRSVSLANDEGVLAAIATAIESGGYLLVGLRERRLGACLGNGLRPDPASW